MMILGIDVGGTSTDAVLLNAAGISGKVKTETTTDIFTGILSVIEDLQRHHDGDHPLRNTRRCYAWDHMLCYQQLFTRLHVDHRIHQGSSFTLSHNKVAPVARVTVMLHSDLQRIELICLGTTHFINALIRQHELAHVAVLRLCGPATRALPPFCDMPAELIAAIGQQYYMLPGDSLLT